MMPIPITVELRILPEEAHNETLIKRYVAQKLNKKENDISECYVSRRSIDARGKIVLMQLRVDVFFQAEQRPAEPIFSDAFKNVAEAIKKVIIVGAGPAGYFAALECLEMGLQPIVLDRGKDVQARRRDLRAIQQEGIVNPHSNYCFGEGGAGTYSDGKLYTRSHKRGNIYKALKLLVEHGANTDILVEAHPHIGSNKLPNVVANIRETIVQYGGKVIFDAFVTDFLIQKNEILGVIVNDREEYKGDAVILATGHSARDIYELCHRRNVQIEAKPFALGVRIEHPQSIVDEVQYRQHPRSEYLPAASYSLVTQAKGRGVFSFCMCPGGLIVPAATAPNELVVNGMSMSRRDSAFANSGTVVAVELTDVLPFEKEHGIFAALHFQKTVEQAMFRANGDGSQKAPAQRLTDFVNKKISNTLAPTSYIPGLTSAPMHEILPKEVYERLQIGVQQFGKMMKGYWTAEANVIGTESRTSSPIRIPRHSETLMHEGIKGLFPCGEGAGYAGGIISAALDGQNVAKAVGNFLNR